MKRRGHQGCSSTIPTFQKDYRRGRLHPDTLGQDRGHLAKTRETYRPAGWIGRGVLVTANRAPLRNCSESPSITILPSQPLECVIQVARTGLRATWECTLISTEVAELENNLWPGTGAEALFPGVTERDRVLLLGWWIEDGTKVRTRRRVANCAKGQSKPLLNGHQEIAG